MLMFYLAMLDTPEQKSKFQMIYENYTGQILQTAHSLARNHMDAEDIAQDVFLKKMCIRDRYELIQNQCCYNLKFENPFSFLQCRNSKNELLNHAIRLCFTNLGN